MELDRNGRKRLANLAKHGLDFARAAELFAGAVVATEDSRRDYREHRMIAIGISAGKVLACAYTDRTDAEGRVVRRIISLRPASRKERQRYDDDTRPAP